VDWDAKNGWHKPVIMPYGDLSISPASTGLHYGLQVSECERVAGRGGGKNYQLAAVFGVWRQTAKNGIFAGAPCSNP
jgi:hypothetical protein